MGVDKLSRDIEAFAETKLGVDEFVEMSDLGMRRGRKDGTPSLRARTGTKPNAPNNQTARKR